ncbi:MAG TPA: proton-conducting transporter membrane subunit [Verrucomicrobiae bacterium]|nr:proton-conducting transporter membrane subunit [Verrucomicrobiae bacterium]
MALLLLGAIVVLFSSSQKRNLSWIGAMTVCGAAILASIPAIQILSAGGAEQFRSPWPVPFGEFFIGLDRLSAWFLLPMLLLSALCAVYGVGYLQQQKNRSLGPVWFFYNLLVLGMTLVLVARNAVLFLSAWELMAVTSFFLVTFEHKSESVRNAGWIYLVATHLGTGFLLAFFILAARETHSMDFNVWAAQGIHTSHLAGILFLLAGVGFGTKAGFMPFHVWLPEAHPAAPGHVSALMSGAMIKIGIYGLLRTLLILGAPEIWWGWLLLCVGLTSGILGIVFALAQHDLKRLLAYSSVENIGLITAGIGLGLLGISYHEPVIAIFGFAAALLHVWNHSLFKGLLFLAAGSVAHATGSLDTNRLGGLLKKLPWTGSLFFLGAVSICGLPPLNGFLSELILAAASLKAVIASSPEIAIAGLAALLGIALIGGLAAVAFTKAFGSVFLGEPRQAPAANPHEAKMAMKIPMLLLAAGCIAIAFGAAMLPKFLLPLSSQLSKTDPENFSTALQMPTSLLAVIPVCGLALIVLFAAIFLFRKNLFSNRKIAESGTWDCGYAKPTARIQYTSSSFAQPATNLFHWLLGTRRQLQKPEGLFPDKASFSTETPDFSHEELYRPGFLKLNWVISKLRWMQQGHVQLYVLYIALTLIVLLAWKFR